MVTTPLVFFSKVVAAIPAQLSVGTDVEVGGSGIEEDGDLISEEDAEAGVGVCGAEGGVDDWQSGTQLSETGER